MNHYEFDTLKIEKEKAMQRYNQFKKIGSIFRTLEICFAVMVFFYSISKSLAYAPAAITLCNTSLRRLSAILFSPHFVFLLGNLIVVTLFINYGKFEKNNADTDEVLLSTGRKIVSCDDDEENNINYKMGIVEPPKIMMMMTDINSPEEEESTIFEEKQVISEKMAIVPSVTGSDRNQSPPPPVVQSVTHEEKIKEKEIIVPAEVVKEYRRTKSEGYKTRRSSVLVETKEEKKNQFRRSKTDTSRRSSRMFEPPPAPGPPPSSESDHEVLSNDEFRNRVEAFIARQQTRLRQESMSISISRQDSGF